VRRAARGLPAETPAKAKAPQAWPALIKSGKYSTLQPAVHTAKACSG